MRAWLYTFEVSAGVLWPATADTAAAQRLGVDLVDVLINLRDSGLGETEAALVLTGNYLPYIDKPLAKWELIRRLRQQQRQPVE